MPVVLLDPALRAQRAPAPRTAPISDSVWFDMEFLSILLVSAYYLPHVGGVERFTSSVARALVQDGHRVVVLASSTVGLDSGNDDGVDVIAIPSFSVMGNRFPIILPSAARAVKRLRSMRFDAVVINTRYYPISLLGCSIAKGMSIRPIVIDHSSGYLSSSKGLGGAAIRQYERMTTSFVRRYDPAFYAVSSQSEAWLSTLGIESQGIIHNSIDVASFTSGASSDDWRSRFSIGNRPLAVYASRLVEEKGVLRAIAAVRKTNLNRACDEHVVLAIAGDGPLREQVEHIDDRDIVYLGLLNSGEMASLLLQADMFVFPSLYPEGLPTVLLEAAACRCAIVSSDCGGARDLVPNGEYGIVLDRMNEGELSTAISKVSADRAYRMRIEDNLYNRVLSSFSWEDASCLVIEACRAQISPFE